MTKVKKRVKNKYVGRRRNRNLSRIGVKENQDRVDVALTNVEDNAE